MARRAHGEGTVYYEEARQRWVGEINLGRDPVTGKRRRRKVTGSSQKAVADKLAALRDKTRDGVDVFADSPTVGALYGPWVARKAERVAPATAQMYRDLWSGHVVHFTDRPADAVTVIEVEGFLSDRRHLSTTTLRKIRGLLAQVLDEGVRLRVVTFNAARLAHLPAGAKAPRASRTLTPDEATALLNAAAGDRLEAWLVLSLYTGARPGEIASLVWEDIDLDDWTVRLTATKTNTVRVLRLPAHVADVLLVHNERLEAERRMMGDRWPASDLVFVSESGTKLDQSNVRRLMARYAADAGLDWVPTPYSLRHSHASILSATGVHAEALAQRLGHRDSRTTTQYYIHPTTPVVEVGADLDLRG